MLMICTTALLLPKMGFALPCLCMLQLWRMIDWKIAMILVTNTELHRKRLNLTKNENIGRDDLWESDSRVFWMFIKKKRGIQQLWTRKVWINNVLVYCLILKHKTLLTFIFSWLFLTWYWVHGFLYQIFGMWSRVCDPAVAGTHTYGIVCWGQGFVTLLRLVYVSLDEESKYWT